MGDKKLETADELLDLFNDIERLKAYKYTFNVVSDSGIDNTKFHLELPYEEIKAIVEGERDRIKEKLPESEQKDLVWEHVGSTSIKGMPGAMHPDALILLKQFPPSRSLVQALLDCGYYFTSPSMLDIRDLWFIYVFNEGVLKDHKQTIHITVEDNVAAKMLLETRDRCRTEQWAFDDYRNAKIEAAKGTWIDYKKGKGSNSKLLVELREKYKQ